MALLIRAEHAVVLAHALFVGGCTAATVDPNNKGTGSCVACGDQCVVELTEEPGLCDADLVCQAVRSGFSPECTEPSTTCTACGERCAFVLGATETAGFCNALLACERAEGFPPVPPACDPPAATPCSDCGGACTTVAGEAGVCYPDSSCQAVRVGFGPSCTAASGCTTCGERCAYRFGGGTEAAGFCNAALECERAGFPPVPPVCDAPAPSPCSECGNSCTTSAGEPGVCYRDLSCQAVRIGFSPSCE